MSKKYKLLLLFLAGLFLLSSCRETPNPANDSNADTTQTDEPAESTAPGEIGDPPFNPQPIFETRNSNEYETFLQSQDCSVSLFSLDTFAFLGDFSCFEAYKVSSILDFDVKYRFQLEQFNTEVVAISRSQYLHEDYLSAFGDIYIKDEDMPDNLCVDPRTHWLRNSENELVEAAYYQKYNIGSDDKNIHFKINDNIVLRYFQYGKYLTMHFRFDDYVMELRFGQVLDDSEFICTNPTIKALFTKSTAKETAEELYNLWKDALK